MAFVTKFFLVIIFGMLLLVAIIMAFALHWTVCALVVIVVGVVTAVSWALTYRRARTRRERLEDEYLNSWPLHNALLHNDRPGSRLGGILTGESDEDEHA